MPITPGLGADASPSVVPDWPAIHGWAQALIDRIAAEHAFLHVAVLVPVPSADRLVLAGQRWGAGRDLGEVVVGGWTVPLDGSICGRAFREGRPALVFDVRLDPDFRSYPGADTRSELAVPVVRDGRPVAVINLEAPRVSAFTLDDLASIEAAAADAATTCPGA